MGVLAGEVGLRSVFEKPFTGEHFPFREFGGGILRKMFYFGVLMACLAVLGEAEPRTHPRRYKPVIQVTEEIDINDITFTTSAPEFERSSSHKTAPYHGGKQEAPVKGGYGNPSPVVFNYGTAVPLERIYGTAQPLVAKYKPYKVFKVQDAFRPVSYKPKSHDKSNLPTTYGGPETPKQNTKVLPVSSPSPIKAATRTANFLPQDNKNFIPSPTFSPTVLALINSENNKKLVETPDASAFTVQKSIDWPKPTKKPYRIKPGKKLPDSSQVGGTVGDDFVASTEILSENSSPYAPHKAEAPQQSESFLSEVSAIHKDGSAGNALDGVGDSLDLKTGERVEFQMYGMDGPQSYKFGFDTGKGHNRHFRFEERDNTGKVKGHYGYLDEDGKMRIMKYEADPITGFHAGPVEISPDEN